MNEKVKQIVTLIATFAGVLAPALGAFAPSSSSTAQVSAQYFDEVLVIPADYAFAIWGPIYLGFLAFAVFQALPDQRYNPRFVKTRGWLSAAAILNAAWITAFDNLLFTLSLVIIIGMLVTALRMHRTMEIGKTRVFGLERYLRIPFSLFAGWLTVATVVNVSGVLAVNDWGEPSFLYPVWGVTVLLAASVIGLTTRFYWRDPLYGGVFAWALLGIALKDGRPSIIVLSAALLAGLFALSLFPQVVRGLLGSSEDGTRRAAT